MRGVTQLSQVPGLSACTGGAIAGLFSRPLTIVSCFLNGSNGLRIGVSSKPLPSAAGVQCSMIAPCGRYMNPMRGFGSPPSAPAPSTRDHRVEERQADGDTRAARNVRRDRCFFVMNMAALRSSGAVAQFVDAGVRRLGVLRIWNGALFTMPITIENR